MTSLRYGEPVAVCLFKKRLGLFLPEFGSKIQPEMKWLFVQISAATIERFCHTH
jgi:hypothetical protein